MSLINVERFLRPGISLSFHVDIFRSTPRLGLHFKGPGISTQYVASILLRRLVLLYNDDTSSPSLEDLMIVPLLLLLPWRLGDSSLEAESS